MSISVLVCADNQRPWISMVLELQVVVSHPYSCWKLNSDPLEKKYMFLPCLAISPAQEVTSHRLTLQTIIRTIIWHYQILL